MPAATNEIAYTLEHSPAYSLLRLDLKANQTVLVEAGAMAAMALFAAQVTTIVVVRQAGTSSMMRRWVKDAMNVLVWHPTRFSEKGSVLRRDLY